MKAKLIGVLFTPTVSLAVIFAFIMFAACRRPSVSPPVAPSTPVPAPVTSAPSTPTLTPPVSIPKPPPKNTQAATQKSTGTASSAIPPSTPPPRRFAPQGIYFLLHYVSIPTDDGVAGIPAGTQVRLVKETDDKVLVTTGREQFELNRSSLTNDLDVAAAVMRHDAQSQATFNKFRQQQEQLADKAKAEAEAEKAKANSQEQALKKRVRQLEAERASQEEMIPGLRVTPRPNPLDLPPRRR